MLVNSTTTTPAVPTLVITATLPLCPSVTPSSVTPVSNMFIQTLGQANNQSDEDPSPGLPDNGPLSLSD